MPQRAVVVLGIGQLVSWGVLYYAFALLVSPVARELGAPMWAVTGAFSLALLMSAALAPIIGRWCDQGRGPAVMQGGGLAAAALLVVWTLLPGIVALYVVWAGIGLCMAAVLYEPAFAIVGRAHQDPTRRLRALAVVTLAGGLASTVFLPLTALLIARAGWRSAVLVLAALLTVATVVTRTLALRRDLDVAAHVEPGTRASRPRGSGPLLLTGVTFALVSLVSAGFTVNLVPALGERGVTPVTAALLGGLIGVMQLPGRALLLSPAFCGTASRLLTISLLSLGVGLCGVALAPAPAGIAAAMMVFAAGAGLTTLVRPHLLQTAFEGRDSGYLNGRVARHQQFARAVGPMAIAWLASPVGYATVFAVAGCVFAVLAVATRRLGVSSGGG